MGLCLRDAVYHVRTAIGELNEFNWSDYQIITDLNWSAKKMCSKAGALTRFQNLTMSTNGTTGTQEVALDVEVDNVKACKYFSGQLFDLQPHDWKSLQVGASTGSIPLWYYLKTSTRQLTPQSVGTSDIAVQDIGPSGPLGEQYRTVLGVWPIPPLPAQVHVWYSYWHPQMHDPTDPCEIPPTFLEGWAAGAIARCLKIEKAYAEAQMYDQQFDTAVEEYRVYASRQRNGDKPAKYGVIQEPWRQNASSSVILVDPYPTM